MRTNVRQRLPQFEHGPPPIGNPIENKEARSNWQAPDRSELVHASHGRVSLDWSIAPVHQVGNHDGSMGLTSRLLRHEWLRRSARHGRQLNIAKRPPCASASSRDA